MRSSWYCSHFGHSDVVSRACNPSVRGSSPRRPTIENCCSATGVVTPFASWMARNRRLAPTLAPTLGLKLGLNQPFGDGHGVPRRGVGGLRSPPGACRAMTFGASAVTPGRRWRRRRVLEPTDSASCVWRSSLAIATCLLRGASERATRRPRSGACSWGLKRRFDPNKSSPTPGAGR